MSDEPGNIKNLDELLRPHLKSAESIEDVRTTRLTAVGDNYGSLMLRLEIKLRNDGTKDSRTLEVVAKTLPRSEFVRQIFNVQVTFKNEIAFYTSVIPALDRFAKERDASATTDFVPKSYGGRINLNPDNDVVDDDAVLILENLKILGYKNGSRQEGLDLQTSKLVLDAFVKLHAYSIALRLEEPAVFESEVKPYLHDFIVDDKFIKDMVDKTTNILKSEGVAPDLIGRSIQTIKNKNKDEVEPWIGVAHNDSWVNNFMIKWDEDNKPVGVKLVDFQVCEYKSVLRDILFFLFTSVRNDILADNLDKLLDHYYENFVATLKNIGVDASRYSRESYDQHLKIAARDYVYFHVVMMLDPILTDKPVDLSSLSFEEMENMSQIQETCRPHKDKLVLVTNMFNERGWLIS
ncbi:uncharacterized protein LOC132707186 [Cylas formicarius]|uniref:uncharacterized protein LOC132707186 n=1 Tax=Cylas formicarius TaxID=197179 RepID=UPI0029589AA9|nr:uncharacterized protein LOC132707186 [Cylas formicarius]